MTFRITEQSRLSDQVSYLQNAEQALSKVQQELSTGRQVNVPSDDPEGTALSMSYRRDIAFEAQMRQNIQGGVSFMNATDSALSGAGDVIQRARELAVEGANGTTSQSGRDAMATEVDQLLQQMVQLANTNFSGAYIFSGTRTDQPAYATTGSPITAVTYQGDTGERLRQISKEATSAVNVNGPEAFSTVFQDLITLRDNLRAGSANVNASIASMDKDLDTLLAARATVGARTNAFNDMLTRSQSRDTELQQLRSNIEDVDISQSIVELTNRQNQLQAAMGAIGHSVDLTLLNFIK